MNAQLLKLLWEWAKAQLLEKLTAKAEKSPEAIALDKIRAVVEGFSSRYSERVVVREIYDPLSSILRDSKPEPHDGPLKYRRPFAVSTLIVKYINTHTATVWDWPTILNASDLWYGRSLDGTGFERIQRWHPPKFGDIAVFGTRIGNGHGALGVVVEAKGNTVAANVDDIGTFVYRVYPTSDVLGYFRPISPQKATK